MATINITIDTEDKNITANIDGKEVPNVKYASVSCCDSYYKKGQKDIYWNITCDNPTGDDDFASTINFCSAAEVFTKSQVSKARTDIYNYFDKKSGR